MKKSKLESALKLIPDVLKEVGEYLSKSTTGILNAVSSNTGTIGLVIEIFGQPMIDSYFRKQEQNKLENYGTNTYLEASLLQAGISLAKTLEPLNNEYSIVALTLGFEKVIDTHTKRVENSEWFLFFQPKYHPIVLEIQKIVEDFLKSINVQISDISNFRKNYFDEIDSQIIKTFGKELYDKHLDEIKEFLLKENETKLLNDNLHLSKIGFKENENLLYEEPYGELKPVSDLFITTDIQNQNSEIKKKEDSLIKVQDLITQYYEIDRDSHLEKILFLIADFGKGKSVFLRHYATELSKKYLETSTGVIPVYFNLRNYKDYSDEHFLGIIGDFLEIKYGIKINDEYFRQKRFVFLIDSLDECGELNAFNIDKVVSSIKKIQNIDPVLYKQNKIIISTRPFDQGLKRHLQIHKPFIFKNKENRPVEYFISLYGFKKSQFNNWLISSLKNISSSTYNEAEGLNKLILQSIKEDKKYDIANALVEKGIISYSELRRPIFSYMIFQLMLNSINFDKSGKIGVYLSFLNLLTKEAKYLHDIDYKINLVEQFEARNILHTTAALWLNNKNSSNTSEIKKAQICRALEGEYTNETDAQVISRFKEAGVAEMEFLSHSYFGENNNMLHFQHQSFAEILLAEYYLKVIIKYALDEEFDYEQARIKLTVGEPTLQTIEFLKELIVLLKDSVSAAQINAEQRKLLFPLLAALATRKNNKTLHSNYLFYTWYSNIKFEENISEFPQKAISQWPIDLNNLSKIIELCVKIIESENILLIQSGEFKTSLYNNEVLKTQSMNSIADIDKYIALVCGNLLFNKKESDTWFNGKLNNPIKLFDLIIQGSRGDEGLPIWARNYFSGINFENNRKLVRLSFLRLWEVDFSNSKLKGILFNHSNLNGANFSNCEFVSCDFGFCEINRTDFSGSKISNYSRLALAKMLQGVNFPYLLAEKAWRSKLKIVDDRDEADLQSKGIFSNFGDSITVVDNIDEQSFEEFAIDFINLVEHGYNQDVWTKEDIIGSIKFKNDLFSRKFRTLVEDNLGTGKIPDVLIVQ